MSPSRAPTSMNAAITSVYAVIASCMPCTVVSRSSTTCEIDTFMTVVSSTMMNCAVPSSMIVVRFFIGAPDPGESGAVRALENEILLGGERLVCQHAAVVKCRGTVEFLEAVAHRGHGRATVHRGGGRPAALPPVGEPRLHALRGLAALGVGELAHALAPQDLHAKGEQ